MQIISYIIIGIIVIIFISPINFYDTKNEPVNYIVRSLYHANTTHLLINMFSFYNLSFMEDVIGKTKFLTAILFIWIVSSILLYFYQKIFPSRKKYTVGFSAVIFGLIVVYYSLINISKRKMLLPLLASIIPQLFMIGISFEGHICGIIAGFMFVTLFPIK